MATTSVTAQQPLREASATLQSPGPPLSPAPITSDCPPAPAQPQLMHYHQAGFPKSSVLGTSGPSSTTASPTVTGGSTPNGSTPHGGPSPAPTRAPAPAPSQVPAPPPAPAAVRAEATPPAPLALAPRPNQDQGTPYAGGFPSPPSSRRPGQMGAIRELVQRLTTVMQTTNPSSVRQAVRDNWEIAILGSDYHLAFVVSLPPSPAGPSSRLDMPWITVWSGLRMRFRHWRSVYDLKILTSS